MPQYDKLSLGRRAKELGFARDSFEKMSRLTEILQYLNENNELKHLLALKGGTAINLTMFNLPRLSVDIDFDFAVNLPRAEVMERRVEINDVLGRYMNSEGYSKKNSLKNRHALDSFVYSYTNAVSNLDNIKIDINYSLRSHIFPIVESKTQTGGVFTDFTAYTLSPIEIFASKAVALSDRAAARDLYDLYQAIRSNILDKASMTPFRKCATFYLAVTGKIKSTDFDFSKLDEITENVIHTDLRQMIRSTERFSLNEAKSTVSSFLLEHLILNDKEVDFLKQFASGIYKPDLLFDDVEIISRIKTHPMALWRQQKIRNERVAR
ncbi:MAG: nucleotidyl transferase AbiEii/AbiGii toxin family protein [Oscillospiraceae bacterium]|nr:nucleotidyl transferase AbiEii/AbiGii toxin family protein [Oscillospiraceae bacterium]MCL2279263.1 nucleotidyl transferase AbiEii/AbiGii toxin family protein [Oscillospiraceae bacterium]